jgi:hypothetical protein
MKHVSPARIAADLEPLERRAYLSSVVLVDGILTIRGGRGDQQIWIHQVATVSPSASDPIVVTMTGAPDQRFPTALIRDIHAYGDGGNDVLQISSLIAPRLNGVSLFGGPGNDSVDANFQIQSKARIRLHGGDGNDTLYNGGYATALYGDGGNDTLLGSAAGELLDGGAGNDTLSTLGGGTSTPAGGHGETLRGGAGDDVIVDTVARTDDLLLAPLSAIHGAVPGFTLDGGPGNDLLVGNFHDAADRTGYLLTGGAGDDRILAYGGERITDAGRGHDLIRGADRFTGVPATDATAALTVTTVFTNYNQPAPPPDLRDHIGDNGPNSPLILDATGTLHLRGPIGSTFTLGQLLIDAGLPPPEASVLPAEQTQIELTVNLSVNGVSQPDVYDYPIHPSDQLVLSLTYVLIS